MRLETKISIKVVLVFLIGIPIVVWAASLNRPQYVMVEKVYQKDIPTPTELQERLTEAGYDVGEIDGKIGTRTKEAWEKYSCDKYYRQELKRLQEIEK